MTKQTATFEEVQGFRDADEMIGAVLRGVQGHPRLGNEDIVYTTRIEKMEYDDAGKVFVLETRNTIYKRR